VNDELRDHAAYAAHLRGVLQEFTQLFADHRQNALPNTVSIDVLGSVVYLNGILTSRSRAQFQFIVDKTLAAVAQMSDLPPPGDLIAIFHSFALNLRNDAPIAEPVMGYVAPAVKTSAPLAVKKCVTCKASFVPMLEHHTFCTSCSRAGITAQRATRAAAKTKALVSPAAPPTPVAVVETYSREQWEACQSPQMQQLMALQRSSGAVESYPSVASPYGKLMQSLSGLVAGADSPAVELPRSQYMAAVPGPLYSPYAMTDMVLTAPLLEFYTDTGATYHCTNDLRFLARVSQCQVFCGGIGSGITFTHVGLDLRFPVGLRKIFYAKDGACLTSPGYLITTGRAAFVQ